MVNSLLGEGPAGCRLKGGTDRGMIILIDARLNPSSQRGESMRSPTASIRKADSLTADVVIVGAGPAGCAAAYDLAVRGIGVLLLDRTEFPRRKACAGGLTIKTVRTLRFSVTAVIQKTARNLLVSSRMRHPKLLKNNRPICHLVDRTAFDHFCLKKAVAAGARFSVVRRIERIMETRRDAALVTDSGNIRCRFIIGADGVNSRIRQLSGRFPAFRAGFAVEGIVNANLIGDRRMGFDFHWVNGGYGWVFPKDGHFNVGLYTSRADVRIRRRHLADYASQRIGGPQPTGVIGYPLGMGGWRYRPGRGRVLLAGDAAGLVDPLLGEGLYHAIISGQHAASAVGDALDTGRDACHGYARRLKTVRRDLLFSQLVAGVFYRLPRAGHLMLSSPAVGYPLMNGFSRGMPLLELFCNGYRFWLEGIGGNKRNSF
jgi:geranylgeranyl reductase family protein